jgi:hypothetical protein
VILVALAPPVSERCIVRADAGTRTPDPFHYEFLEMPRSRLL